MKLLRLVALLLVTYLSTIVINTLIAFYPGTGSVGAQGPEEREVQVRVVGCDRVGPLHDRRLGFWWVCRVQLPDGGRAEVDRSILTKDDVGRTVQLHQACFDPPGGHCTLGESAGTAGQIYAGGLRILGRILLVGLLVWALTLLLAGAVGAPRYVGFIDWWQRRMVRGRQ